MEKLILFVKTYRADFESCSKLIKSINQYNKDEIKLLISVNDEDISFFKQNLQTDLFDIIKDSDIIAMENKDPWQYQQIVKSQLHRLNITENYVCLDSDSYFIKDFYISDFIQDDVPYTIIHQQKEMFSWLSNNRKHFKDDPKQYFEDISRKIMAKFGRKGICYDYGPSPTIWSNKVWKDFQKNYLDANNINYPDLIHEFPSEFTWYGEWLLKSNVIPLFPKEPLFKVFHYKKQFQDFIKEGHTRESIKENYLGVVLQSNWNRDLKWYQKKISL